MKCCTLRLFFQWLSWARRYPVPRPPNRLNLAAHMCTGRSAGDLAAAGLVGDLTAATRVNYAAIVPVISYETMGWLRAAVGVALIAAPAAPMRFSGREQPTAASMLLMRTIGIRDLVLGLGSVAAARADTGSDARRWSTAVLASDSLDTAASLASIRSIGKRDSWAAALLSAAFVCGDLRARRPAGQCSSSGTARASA